MKTHRSVAGVAVFAILITTSTSFAHGGDNDPTGMGRGMMHGMMSPGMRNPCGAGKGMMNQ